jgi:hypothetical protein
MPVILMPACWIWRIACSRPAPGPFTRTSHSSTPCFRAAEAAFSAARPAAKGVLFRAPLKPTVPADAHDSVSPFVSVIVTTVLLNVALMWAMARVTPLRTRFLGPGFPPAAGFAVSAMCSSNSRINRTTPSPRQLTLRKAPRGRGG